MNIDDLKAAMNMAAEQKSRNQSALEELRFKFRQRLMKALENPVHPAKESEFTKALGIVDVVAEKLDEVSNDLGSLYPATLEMVSELALMARDLIKQNRAANVCDCSACAAERDNPV